LAASGGCPELLRVSLDEVHCNLDWLTYEPSLILPSVRYLDIDHNLLPEEEGLLLWCGIVHIRREQGLEVRLWGWASDRYPADQAWLRRTLSLGDMRDVRLG
jgi:hypothetical protein